MRLLIVPEGIEMGKATDRIDGNALLIVQKELKCKGA